MSRALPSFDLVVATVDRTEELDRLLDSLAAQDYPRLRVIVVDQNEDERLVPILSRTRLLVSTSARRAVCRAHGTSASGSSKRTSWLSRTTTAPIRRAC